MWRLVLRLSRKSSQHVLSILRDTKPFFLLPSRLSVFRYWLPSLLKHKFVALRFVAQYAYERAAPLDVSPKPDIVQRVFMLFKGVDLSLNSDQDLPDDWVQAEERAKLDVNLWREVVGLKGERGVLMGDDSLFRVLEWGGMEVLSK